MNAAEELRGRLAAVQVVKATPELEPEQKDDEDEVVRVIPAAGIVPELPVTRREQRKMDDASRQPENDETPFHVGMKDKWGYPQAVPPFHWPSPGALYADSVPVWEAYEKYLGVRMSTAQALRRYLAFLRLQNRISDYAGKYPHEVLEATQDIGALMDAWTRYGITPPSEKYLLALACGQTPETIAEENR